MLERRIYQRQLSGEWTSEPARRFRQETYPCHQCGGDIIAGQSCYAWFEGGIVRRCRQCNAGPTPPGYTPFPELDALESAPY